jgi:dihydrofolate reductase
MSKVFEAIVAMDEKNGISLNNRIPWKSKTDMNFFKTKTINNVVIMGSKTLLSLPNAKPLQNRLNIVLTRNAPYYEEKYSNYSNIMFVTEEKLLQFVKNSESYFDITKHPYLSKNYNIYLIGGEQVYKTFCIYCSTIWVTKIKSDYKCDLIFSFDLTAYDKTIEYEDDELQTIKATPLHL